MTWEERIANYERVTGFPKSMFIAGDGRVIGMWIMGNNYRVKSKYYGGYPAGYLRRLAALFPDKRGTLHLFSGRADTAILPGKTVDINADLKPDYVDDAQTLTKVPVGDFDLIAADPAYSAEDSEHYGTPMINRNKVLRAISAKATTGTHLAWLDQVLPMYRKTELRIEAVIGIVKSTNHRFRVLTIFGKQ